jgi:hypothetical protein
MDQVAPGAASKTIRENRAAIKVLFDHGHDPQIGNKPLGPIRELRATDTGDTYRMPAAYLARAEPVPA